MAERDQRTRSPRAGRTADPFRPALQVLAGGQPRGRGRAAEAEADSIDGGDDDELEPRRERDRKPSRNRKSPGT